MTSLNSMHDIAQESSGNFSTSELGIAEWNNSADHHQKVELLPCPHCSRKFSSSVLVRHSRVCQQANKKRPVFDMKSRIFPEVFERKGNPLKSKKTISSNYKHKRWYKQHQDLIANLRDDDNRPGFIYKDYIQCNLCMRSFAPYAAQKHIERCRRISQQIPTLQKLTRKSSYSLFCDRKIRNHSFSASTCQECFAKLPLNSNFCNMCGSKVKVISKQI